jgi:hypothetical protein
MYLKIFKLIINKKKKKKKKKSVEQLPDLPDYFGRISVMMFRTPIPSLVILLRNSRLELPRANPKHVKGEIIALGHGEKLIV